MINQISTIPFGSDASVLAGYALAANDRLGNINFVIENTGPNTLWMEIREFVGVANTSVANSGYFPVSAALTIVPGGNQTVSLSLVSQQVGFFGSGNTVAAISTVFRNPADRRGAQIDIVAVGRVGWGVDPAFPTGAFRPKWGSPPDRPDIPPQVQ